MPRFLPPYLRSWSRTRWLALSLPLSLCLAASLAIAQDDDANRFPFDPKPDDFRPEALLDLRSLNEKEAGESGWVKGDGKGGFLRGDGQELRFWAVGSFVLESRPWQQRPLWPSEKTMPSLAKHARFLAKHGVNMIRMHTSLNPDTKANKEAKLEDYDPQTRDYIWEVVAASKKEGIYTMLTPYWAVAFKPTEGMGLGTDDAHGLLFFDPRVKAAYKGWLKALLTPPNPHTGIPLAQDPSLAIIQIQNEDSTLFWTISGIKEQPKRMLADQFSAWAVKKHGGYDGALKAWGGTPVKGDDAATNHYELLPIYEMTKDGQGGRAKRLDDQLQFWSELMHSFHQEIVGYLRKDLGCQQMVSAGNWHTADTVRLNDSLRWSYTPTEVQSVNRYFPGVHNGPSNAAWTIQPGHVYNSRSFLQNPFDWPLQLKLPRNQPFIITEASWTFPSRTASEGPFLTAAYQSLSGCDAFCWFAFGSEQWSPPRSGNGYMKDTQAKFVAEYPDCLGQFPAAALLFRKGYVKQGRPVVTEARPLADLWQRRKPVMAEAGSYDSRKEPDGPQAPRAKADPRSYFVGPVEVAYGQPAEATKVEDITPYVNDAKRTIRSNTGEHLLDLQQQTFTLDAPCAQGFTAFFQKGVEYKTSALRLTTENGYGVFVAVSMDGKPLSESRKMLLQTGTSAMPKGWKETDAPAEAAEVVAAGKKKNIHGHAPSNPLKLIEAVGGPPWMVERIHMTVRLKSSVPLKATALDPNGYAKGEVPVQRDGAELVIKLPEDSLHVLLEATE